VVLPDRYIGRGNAPSQQSALKLTEIGPRVTLQAYKIEKEVGGGEILYHKYVHKTAEEAEAIRAKVYCAIDFQISKSIRKM